MVDFIKTSDFTNRLQESFVLVALQRRIIVDELYSIGLFYYQMIPEFLPAV